MPFLPVDLLHMTVCYRSFSFSLACRRRGQERIQQGPEGKCERNNQDPHLPAGPNCWRWNTIMIEPSYTTRTSQEHSCLHVPHESMMTALLDILTDLTAVCILELLFLSYTQTHTLTLIYQSKPHQTIRCIKCRKRNLWFCCRPVGLR